MKSTRVYLLAAAFLLVTCAGLAARLDRWFMRWPGNRAETLNPLSVLIGEGQKMFALHFYRKADAYYHSGMYPTIFDNTESFKTAHIAEDAGATASQNEGDEAQYLGKPLDVIDGFSRHFIPSHHTHLDEGGAAAATESNPELKEGKSGEVREMLPWLRLASALDPEMPETYTVTAYWLRQKMGKAKEAEIFLREGLKNLPGHPAILFELGRIYFEDYKDPARARNVWQRGIVEWQKQEGGKPEPDRFILLQLHGQLAQLEEQTGNLSQAITHWEQLLSISPSAESIQARIAGLRKKLAAVPPPK